MTLIILSSLFECICTPTVTTCLRPESLQGYCTTPQHSLHQITTCLVEWRARTFRIFLKPNFYFPTACSMIIGWHVHRCLSDWSASFSCYVENVLQGLFSHKTDIDSTCNPKNDPARTQSHITKNIYFVCLLKGKESESAHQHCRKECVNASSLNCM